MNGLDQTPRVFVSSIGQDTNVGDSLLRRAHLNALRSLGTVHVLVGGTSDDYITGLGLIEGDVVYRNRRQWWTAAFSAAVQTRIVVAFNAGEMQFNNQYLSSYLRHALLIGLSRPRGGRSFHAGLGARRDAPLAPILGCILRLSCDVLAWRDDASRSWARAGLVAPDWALALGSDATDVPSAEDREYLAIVLRGDRLEPTPAWLAAVSAIANSRNLRPLLVVQVERDQLLATRLAEATGWDLDGWTGGSHEMRESQLREIFRRAAAVVSDRVHALLMGATEGAVPIAFSCSSTEKAKRTLGAIGLSEFSIENDSVGLREAVTMAGKLIDRATYVNAQVTDARRSLKKLRLLMRRSLT